MQQGSLYGKGVFTTIRITGGLPFRWARHWRRLVHDSAVVGIDLSRHPESTVRDSLEAAIAERNIVDGRARITFVDESPSPYWSDRNGTRTGLQIIVAERRPSPNPFRVTRSAYPVNSRSPLAGVKSCNYLEPLLCLEEARRRGFDEAIRLNEQGIVTSACMANLFWLNGDKLYTPAVTTGCLPGTTREFVLENLDCEEVEAGIEAVETADAIFLTSAGLGVVPAAAFDTLTLGQPEHPIIDLLPVTR